MNPSLASLICACGIAGLFYLNRDRSLRTSKALWLPVIWICLVGSRPVSVWLGISYAGRDVQLDGSPVDAAVLGVLTVAAIGVLTRRGRQARTLLAANWPILLYFLYCLISVAWSYHPDVAFKRWIKSTGDMAMVLVVLTEPRLSDALFRLFSRVGFLLFPTSLLLIKYYGDLGRGYTPDGGLMNTGVTTNKNSLGIILLVISLGTLWGLITLFRTKATPSRSRQLFAQSALLAFGIALLGMSDSKTSIVCFVLGGGLMLATGTRSIRRRPSGVHILCLGVLLAGGLTMFFGGGSVVTSALGRQSNFSGRTEIWTAVIPAAPNSIIGAGFESFWISPSVLKFQRAMVGWWHPETLNEAHNGYIEVYLELGWVGVGLISWILISSYLHAIAAFRLNPSIGGLILAYIIASAVYSMTEAGFRMMGPIWIFLLLAGACASGIAGGHIKRDEPRVSGLPGRRARRISHSGRPAPESETVYAHGTD
jgi:exopolysaccharide production protein ExoQ